MTLASPRNSILPDRITTPTLRTFLRSVSSVDDVGAAERVASLAKRSIKRESKLDALMLIIRMIDLTTLEGQDTAGKIAQMSARRRRLLPSARGNGEFPYLVLRTSPAILQPLSEDSLVTLDDGTPTSNSRPPKMTKQHQSDASHQSGVSPSRTETSSLAYHEGDSRRTEEWQSHSPT